MAVVTTILSLPNEILDRVFSYLAWTPADSLLPSCPDIDSISLTCRFLRDAVLPTLFRNARLKLRWIDGAIAEPGLYRLRREAPHLAKLVRCVHIQTIFGQDAAWQLKPFSIPLALDNWNTSSRGNDTDAGLLSYHRDRIQQIARQWFGSLPSNNSRDDLHNTDDIARAFFAVSGQDEAHPSEQINEDIFIDPQQATLGEHASSRLHPEEDDALAIDGPTEDVGRSIKRVARRRRLQLDALITCMVSLPPQTQHIIFEAVPTDLHDQLQHTFALQVYAMALRIFAPRLNETSIISRSLDSGRRDSAAGVLGDYSSTLVPVVPELTAVKRLTLAATAGHSDRLSRHSLDAIKASSWQVEPLCSNVTSLALCKIADKRSTIFDCIKSFTSLTDLTIDEVTIGPELGLAFAARRSIIRDPEDPMWLLFLISVRLHRPDLRLHLGKLMQWHMPNTLPASAVRWLGQEAVPVGAKVDFERETRLTEDFGSFINLWTTDDSERGVLARDDAGVGKLVDEAFTNRWRTFANMR